MSEPIAKSATVNDIIVFDRKKTQANRRRAAYNFDKHDFLFDWARRQLAGRLDDIKREFPLGLEIGSRGSLKANKPQKIHKLITIDNFGTPDIIAEEEFLPLASHSIDLVLSTLNLHSVNDLPGALVQIRRALKPDGLFLAAMLGGETLHELRHCMAQAETNIKGGISPRVAPFADKPQMGDLLSRAGFSLPVVDSEIVTVAYENVFKLFADLRGMGEGNALTARYKSNPGKKFFMETARLYHENFSEPDGRIKASFEVIFLIGWAPHESQQKPLRPGSATSRLADALGSTEIKTGEITKP